MKVVFGVMSNKWDMEAEDLKVAKLAMCLHIGKRVPVVIYKPKKSVFMPSMEFIKDNINYKRSAVFKAQDSIKIIRKLKRKGKNNG